MPTYPIDLTLQLLKHATDLTIACARPEGGFVSPGSADNEPAKGVDVFGAWFETLARRAQDDLDR